MRRLALLLLAPLSVLLLSGCIRVEVAVRVAEDGSGAFSFLSAVDTATAEALGALAGGAGDLASTFTEVDESALPPRATVEPYREGTFAGYRVTVPFASAGDVSALLGDLIGGAGDGAPLGGSDPFFESLVLEGDDDGWLFQAQLPRDLASAAGDAADGPALDPALLAPLLGGSSLAVRIALPGAVVEHNADRIEDGELIWDLSILDPGARPLMARTELGGGGGVSPVLVAAAVAAALAAAGGGAWFVRRRRAA